MTTSKTTSQLARLAFLAILVAAAASACAGRSTPPGANKYLGSFVQEQTGRSLILWPGFCPTHARILPRHIEQRKQQFPDAKVIVHPESRPEVIALADAVRSTSGMCRFARETDADTIIVGTELGLIYRLQKENPGKRFLTVSEQAICPNMKRIEL